MDGAGAKASRLFWRKLSPFTGAMGLPADASGAYRPNPQATTKLAPRPSSLKGYAPFPIVIEIWPGIDYNYNKMAAERGRWENGKVS